ncbi:MAG: hypothetical protein JRJ84_20725, partial [Deltaproteobacteria bacterium]|nr:hypothetical protein [Deltaproteobacteria bacterium]
MSRQKRAGRFVAYSDSNGSNLPDVPQVLASKRPAVVLAWVILLVEPAMAADLHVGSGQDHATVQAAVAAATDGDVVLVHEGTYREAVVIDDLDIEIAGVGEVSEVILESDAEDGFLTFSGASVCTVRDVTSDGLWAGRAMTLSEVSFVTVEGIVTVHTSASAGGAIEVGTASDLTVRHASFGPSAASGVGGQILATASSALHVYDSHFEQSSAGADGGSITVNGASLEVYGATFISNSASSGGAVSCRNTDQCIVHDSVFTANTALAGGGGLASDKATGVSLEGNVFCSNATTSNNKKGGALLL